MRGLNNEKRYALLDSLRGLLLLEMIVYHFFWDLVYLFEQDLPWFHSSLCYWWQQSICWRFIFLSGFCWPLGKRAVRRAVQVFGGSEILGSYGLVQGVTLLAFGMFFVIKPGFIAVFLGTALAIIIIVDGILKLQYAVDFYHLESDKWWIELIGAVVMVVIGIIALLNPFSTSSALIVFIGIALMIEGLWDFISLMRIVSVTKKAGKAIKNFKDQVDAVDMK